MMLMTGKAWFSKVVLGLLVGLSWTALAADKGIVERVLAPTTAPSAPTKTARVTVPALSSGAAVKKLLDQAAEGFRAVTADHKGTPWEALAKRSRATVPGLRWVPLAPPKGDAQAAANRWRAERGCY